MTDSSESPRADAGISGRWDMLADQVLQGHVLTPEEGLAILQSDDGQLLSVLAAAYRVRHRWFGNRVHLNFLVNAKSGHCSEDCGYCSQSSISKAEITKYTMLGDDDILDGARAASHRRAGTYCIVISGRGPAEREVDTVVRLVPKIKDSYQLKICVSVGLLSADQALQLNECGVDRVNHNLNTSERFYPKICSTHTYRDRLDTLRAVRSAGLEICSGGIVGMGESDEDVVDLALRLGEFKVEALPVNFLIPIPGTPLEDIDRLNPRYCLKVLSLFRMASPNSELRIAAGREVHLGSLQPLGLYAASSIFVGDYLTTKGQTPEADYRMIEALGFEAVSEGARD